MEMKKRVLEEEHPDTLLSMETLAITHQEQGRGEEALLLLEKCIQLREKVIGPHHPYTKNSRQRLAVWRKEEKGPVRGHIVLLNGDSTVRRVSCSTYRHWLQRGKFLEWLSRVGMHSCVERELLDETTKKNV